MLTWVIFRVKLIYVFKNPLFYAVFETFYYFLTWKTMNFLPAVPEYCCCSFRLQQPNQNAFPITSGDSAAPDITPS